MIQQRDKATIKQRIGNKLLLNGAYRIELIGSLLERACWIEPIGRNSLVRNHWIELIGKNSLDRTIG